MFFSLFFSPFLSDVIWCCRCLHIPFSFASCHCELVDRENAIYETNKSVYDDDGEETSHEIMLNLLTKDYMGKNA